MSDTQNAEFFTLRPSRWYAAEFIGDEFGEEVRSYSPIGVDAVVPARTGRGLFALSFYHADYPEGARGKTYSLRTVERAGRYILARSTEHSPARLLLIYDVSWPWMRKHFGVERPRGDDIGRWLSENA